MSLSELWAFISENADALSVLLALATFIGGVIGFLIKTIWGRFSKSSEQKREKIADLENIIANLKHEVCLLQEELSQYHSVEKGMDGEYLIHTKTSTKICPICWHSNKKTIPIYDNGYGKYICSFCHHEGIYNFSKDKAEQARQSKFWDSINNLDNDVYDNYNQQSFFNF